MLLCIVISVNVPWMDFVLQLLYPSSIEADTVDAEGNVVEQSRPRHDDDDEEDIESLTGRSHVSCKFCVSFLCLSNTSI